MHQCCLSLSGQRRLEPRKAMGYYQRPLLDKPQGVHEVSTWQEYERWKASNTQKVEDRPCQAIIAVSEASTLRLVDEACGLPWAMRIACEIPPDFDDGEELNACLIQPAACAFGKTPSRVPIGGLGPAKDDHLAFLERARHPHRRRRRRRAAAELSLGAWEVYGFFTRFSIDESIKWRHFQGAVLVGVGPGASVFSGRVWHARRDRQGLEDHEPRKLESRDAMTMFGGKQMIVAPGFIVDEAMASPARRARTADDVDAAAALDARDVHGSWRVAKALAKRAALANLATLELAGAAFGPTLAAAFAEGLRGAAALLVVDLRDTRCRDAGLIALAPALRALPALESLDVGDNGLTDASAAPLSGAWPGLMALKLAGNAFADAAPEPASPYLEILDLSRNALGAARSPGVNAVAAWLASPGAAPLRALDLGSNALTMRHVERLLNAALKAPELRTLDLRGCRSTPALATSVARRTRFTRLDVLLGDAPKSKRASPE
ncbi:hypothetical protein SO694_00194023 [Aureococcus anophagefferens]|uniref:Uncharacterized protein n=1 Tax=Aureococcus anophagefferens TaxID=44056 RepID=A0ABR1FNU8_AURAN